MSGALPALLCAVPVHADTAALGVTTYLREGPGTRYRPLDEVLAGRQVELLGCEAGWCRIAWSGATAYVRQAALADAKARPAPSEARDCFLNRQAGYKRGRNLVICHADPAQP